MRSPSASSLVGLACLLVLLSPSVVSAQILPLGVSEPVSPNPVLFDGPIGVAAHPNQGAMVLYTRAGLAGQGNLRAQRIEETGGTGVAETIVNDSNDAGAAAIAYDNQGHFVVAWAANITAGSTHSVFVRRVNLNGTTTEPPRPLVTAGAPGLEQTLPKVGCDLNGRCAVAWQEGFGRGRVLLRLIDTAGVPTGDAIEAVALDPNSNDAVTATGIAVAPDGTIAVLWVRSTFIGRGFGDSAPFARFFTAGGTPLTEPLDLRHAGLFLGLATAISGAFDGDGRLLASWESRMTGFVESPVGAIYTRLVMANGALPDPARRIESSGAAPAVTWCAAEQRFAVAFDRSLTNLPEPSSLTLQLVDDDGEASGAPIPAAASNQQGFRFAAISCGNLMLWTAFQAVTAPPQPTYHAHLLRLRQGPPLCAGPFLPIPDAVPCGSLGPQGRFGVYAAFRNEDGHSRFAEPISVSNDASFFAFYDAENPELATKIVDGSTLNDHFWFFYGALSDREYALSVYDFETGLSRVYANPLHHLASVGDTSAFAADAPQLPAELRTAAPASRPAAPADSAISLADRVSCPVTDTVLCLPASGARIRVHWRDFQGHEGEGHPVRLTNQGGWFWFFNPQNLELAIKVLDGRPLTGNYWVFYASLSNVEFTIRIEDELGQLLREYTNTSGGFLSVADTTAFP